MGHSGELILRVHAAAGEDAGELAAGAMRLRDELLDLDIAGADWLSGDAVPPDAKGVAAAARWLIVRTGPAALRAVLAKAGDWASRNDRTVEVSYGGDKLKLGRATREQQEKIIDDWLARHLAGP
jgi:hypothetical protein